MRPVIALILTLAAAVSAAPGNTDAESGSLLSRQNCIYQCSCSSSTQVPNPASVTCCASVGGSWNGNVCHISCFTLPSSPTYLTYLPCLSLWLHRPMFICNCIVLSFIYITHHTCIGRQSTRLNEFDAETEGNSSVPVCQSPRKEATSPAVAVRVRCASDPLAALLLKRRAAFKTRWFAKGYEMLVGKSLRKKIWLW